VAQGLDPDVEWITAREAAVILGVSLVRVSQLTRRDLLPSVRRDSRYYYRRAQVQVIANARQQRWHSVDADRLG
jgi:DNA-binding transcriptional MerR regulator